jgi:hypothetical protein
MGDTNVFTSAAHLSQGQMLISASRSCYLAVEADGRLAVHRGSGPDDDRGAIWASPAGPGADAYFASVDSSGVLAVHAGSAPGDDRGVVWSTGGGSSVDDHFRVTGWPEPGGWS